MRLADRMIDFVHRWATGPAVKRWPVSIAVMLFFIGGAVGLVWVAVLLDSLLGLRVSIHHTVRQIVGWVLFIPGVILMLWTVLFFFRAHGTPVPLNPPRRLVTTGPYGVTRNPMLSGWFVAFFGAGILLGSAFLFFVFTPLLVALFTLFVVRVEEPELTKRFGDEYVQYCKQVPRFFPHRRRRRSVKLRSDDEY